jgi:2'-5' RNA ligase
MNKISKSFYVLYTKNKIIEGLLNAIKILSDESQRTSAHITVRGPYSKKLPQSQVDNFSKNIANTLLHFSKVGNFFDYGQNTVFFKCDDNKSLRKIWKKKGYKDFKPHITLYDGTDKKFAEKLFDKLQQDFKPFNFEVDKLSYLESKPNDGDEMAFYLNRLKQESFNFEQFKDVLNIDINEEEIKIIDEKNKLDYISKFNTRLHQTNYR